MNNFIITCHGWSASNWLSFVLNNHPNMLVSHSAGNLVNNKFENNIKGKVQILHTGYLNRQNKPIAESYKELYNLEDVNLYGSVHLYRLRDFAIQEQKFESPGELFNVVNLIRHPIDLVWSGFGQFRELFKTDINELYWTLGKILDEKEYLYAISEKYQLQLGDIEILSFIGAARVLGSLRLDLDALDSINDVEFVNYLGEVKMEEVTKEPDVLKELILRLSDNEIILTDEYLREIFEIGKINKHKTDIKSLSTLEKYIQMTEWQKEVLNFYLDKYKIIEPYKSFGYNFDFLEI